MAVVGFIGLLVTFGSLSAAMAALLSTPFYSVANINLIVLPLFLLMGSFVVYGRISTDGFLAAHKWVGRIPGSLSIATVLGCVGFGASSGSSIAAASVFTRIGLPEMKRAGYDIPNACGAIVAASIIAMLIPPSLLFVFYAIMTEQNLAELLMAGLLPGLLLAGVLVLTIVVLAVKNPNLMPVHTVQANWREKMKSLLGLWPLCIIATIILVGIYTGAFSPTEAAAVGAFAALVMGFARKELTWLKVKDALLETAGFTAMLFILLIGANLFTRFLSACGVTASLTQFVVGLELPKYVLLISSVLLFLLMGCLIDEVSIMAITLPVIFKPLVTLGFDPIWFGVIVVLSTSIGKLTPPFGLGVFTVKAVVGSDVTAEQIFKGCTYYYISVLLCLAVLMIYPQISLFLPQTMIGD